MDHHTTDDTWSESSSSSTSRTPPSPHDIPITSAATRASFNDLVWLPEPAGDPEDAIFPGAAVGTPQKALHRVQYEQQQRVARGETRAGVDGDSAEGTSLPESLPAPDVKDAMEPALSQVSRRSSWQRDVPLSSVMCPPLDEMHFYSPFTDHSGRPHVPDELHEADWDRSFAELSFNIRVLSMALDPTQAPLDRYRFACIVSMNLDEHFAQRKLTESTACIAPKDPHDYTRYRLHHQAHVRQRGEYEDKLDKAIHAVVREQHECLVREILPVLENNGVKILDMDALSREEIDRVDRHFTQHVMPLLTPLVVDTTHPFPKLDSHNIYLCAIVRDPATIEASHGLAGERATIATPETDPQFYHRSQISSGIPTPTPSPPRGVVDGGDRANTTRLMAAQAYVRGALGAGAAQGPRAVSVPGSTGVSGPHAGRVPSRKVFIKIPAESGRLVPVDKTGLRFVPVERVVEARLDTLCQGMHIESTHLFRVTRNVKLVLEDTDFVDTEDLMERVHIEIHQRRSAPPTRLEIHEDFPDDLRQDLLKKLGLVDSEVFVIDGPLLDLASCMGLWDVDAPLLRRPEITPRTPRRLRGVADTLGKDPGVLFRIIEQKDILIEHPYHSFMESTQLFLAAAARDPKVRSIKQVLYRAGSRSPMVEALIRAAQNGKDVTVLVELKASFDEIRNCEYANALQDAGCNVMYGLLALKVHSKVVLVVREDEATGALKTFCNISTGNFNAKTASFYTDVSLMTCDDTLCADMHDVFNSLTGMSRPSNYREALVAPANMGDRFVELIREEASFARAGKPGRIVAQVNGLSDREIVKELYDASRAGVKIDLFVRGACRLRPGLSGVSENIRVFSWIGPLLQHRRVYYFYADGSEKFFIGSADWRTRNLNQRTEVVIPIKDHDAKRRLASMLKKMNDERYLWQFNAHDGRYYKTSISNKSISIPIGVMAEPMDPVDANAASDLQAVSTADPTVSVQVPKLDYGARGKRDGSGRYGSHSRGPLASRRTSEPRNSHSSSSTSSRSSDRPSEKWQVDIRGNKIRVDKIAAGAVPVMYTDGDWSSLRVLLVQRDDGEDAWSFPKGGKHPPETAESATQRILRKKAAVYHSEVLHNLGWILRNKKSKSIATCTYVLRVTDPKMPTNGPQARHTKWATIEEAYRLTSSAANSFTHVALSRAVSRLHSVFVRTETTADTFGAVSTVAADSTDMVDGLNATGFSAGEHPDDARREDHDGEESSKSAGDTHDETATLDSAQDGASPRLRDPPSSTEGIEQTQSSGTASVGDDVYTPPMAPVADLDGTS